MPQKKKKKKSKTKGLTYLSLYFLFHYQWEDIKPLPLELIHYHSHHSHLHYYHQGQNFHLIKIFLFASVISKPLPPLSKVPHHHLIVPSLETKRLGKLQRQPWLYIYIYDCIKKIVCEQESFHKGSRRLSPKKNILNTDGKNWEGVCIKIGHIANNIKINTSWSTLLAW